MVVKRSLGKQCGVAVLGGFASTARINPPNQHFSLFASPSDAAGRFVISGLIPSPQQDLKNAQGCSMQYPAVPDVPLSLRKSKTL
jgi:hypothetical protein